MARPRSDEKRQAIIDAAIRVIAIQGLRASTASIAQEAGVSNGALFTYFETKSALLNNLYLHLKGGMAQATMTGLPGDADLRGQMLHVWNRWVEWALAHPQERRALAELSVSHELTAATRDAASQAYAGIATLLERSRAHGVLREAPLMLVGSLVVGLLDATVDFMARDPANAPEHAAAGFAALWRMLG